GMVRARRHRVAVDVPDPAVFRVQPIARLVECAVVGRVIALDPPDDLLGVEPSIVDRHPRPGIAADQSHPRRRARRQLARQGAVDEGRVEVVGGSVGVEIAARKKGADQRRPELRRRPIQFIDIAILGPAQIRQRAGKPEILRVHRPAMRRVEDQRQFGRLGVAAPQHARNFQPQPAHRHRAARPPSRPTLWRSASPLATGTGAGQYGAINPRITETTVPETTYKVELVPPDITAYRAGNTGIEYVTTFTADKPGPHVLVCALTHGNEICGALVLDKLFKAGIRPRQGRLTLAFNNVAAYDDFDPRMPIASRYVDEDFNRLWSPATLDGPRKSAELTRARQIRRIVDQADYLLDLHSMQHATAPLMLAGLLDKSCALAQRVGIPELIMCDAGHAAGPRMRDYGGFGDPRSPKAALLIECGQHWEIRAAEVANDVTLRF